MREFGLSESELFPLITEQGHELLRGMREHSHAPKFNWHTGERLSKQGLQNVRAFAETVKAGPTPWRHRELPPWVMPFVESARAKVPFYRDRSNWPKSGDFFSIPITTREDFRKNPASFIPDNLPLEDLIVYTSSGTTGSKLRLPATPELPSRYLPLMQKALAAVGVRLEGGNRISIVHVCAQQNTVVLCSLSSYLDGAGFVKINLDPADWKNPDDAVHFLDDCNAELYTGDPFSLWRLSQLPLKYKPNAIISSATTLSAGVRRDFAARFGCPVIDMYSMNESGPIGFSIVDGVHEILQPRLYVETVDDHGMPCAPGAAGQILLTGGLNPYVPLIRHATGDFAALDYTGGVSILTNFHGRQPINFCTATGELFNSIDITTALSKLSLPRLSVHQNANGSVKVRAAGEREEIATAQAIIQTTFGAGQAVIVEREELEIVAGKPINFSSDL